MAIVFNSARTFKDEMIDGLASAYGRYLRRIPGTAAVASVDAPAPGRVSTVIGGGSGHYPAFAGLVGPGLADAAVCGDIFASPSAEQVYRSICAMDGGAGVLLMFGNYAGDVMHFGLAAEQAKARHGIEARIVLVTDDIASAPPERAGERRGIAGGFYVFRAAAAAAHRGYNLSEVERAARAVNNATRTIGVAFDGCTLPGRDEPLFRVAAESMDVGMGIHGEPGIQTVPRVTAGQLGAMLAGRLLAERPPGADQARLLVNGLGRVKYEELLILHLSVASELRDAGVRLIEPEVGEFVTSLDMAGCSVTVVWTDEEMEQLLSAPAASPGFTYPGPVSGLDGSARPLSRSAPEPGHRTSEVSDADVTPSGRTVRRMLTAMATRMHELEDHLGDLDAVAADGDHGITMTRGIDAAVTAAHTSGPDASAILVAAGMAFADAAGGASGALWGSALTAIGNHIQDPGSTCPGAKEWWAALQAAEQAVTRLGGCALGEKTLIDALHPFAVAFGAAAERGASVPQAWEEASEVAMRAAQETAALAARRGRAARLSERSIGTPDPGAISLAEALAAARPALNVVASS